MITKPKAKTNFVLLVLLGLGFLLNACGSDDTTPLTLATSTTAPTNSVQTTVAVEQKATPTTIANNTVRPTVLSIANTPSVANTITPAVNGATSPSALLSVPTVQVPDSVRQEITRIIEQTEKTRGFTFGKKVESNFMTRADLSKYQEAEFLKNNPPSEVARYNKILQVFEFVPDDFDLARTYIDLLNEQVLGFYDPETKKLYMIVDGDPNVIAPIVKFTAEHELTHALQDQKFNLLGLRPIRKPADKEWNDDQDYALTSIIEGDAVQSQVIWLQNRYMSAGEITKLLGDMGKSQSTQIDKAPLVLKDTLTFPYAEGFEFVQRLYKNGGWDTVNKAFTNYIPKSTSQILHFDKYEKRIEPVKIELSSMVDTLGSDWKSLDINSMGEMQTRIWLQGAISNSEALKAADGWAGDRYQVVENAQGQPGLVWRSQWDSDKEATDFYQQSVTTLKKLYNLTAAGTGSEPKQSWSSSTQDVSLVRKGNQVLVVVMPKGDATNKVVSKLGF